MDKKETLLKTIEDKVDPSYREQIKREIETVARGNKALSDVLDKKASVEQRISSAGDTLLRQSAKMEEKNKGRQTILSRAISELGNDLKQLGSGDFLNQVGTITKWEREASGLVRLLYAKNNNPVQYANPEPDSTTSTTGESNSNGESSASSSGVDAKKVAGGVATGAGLLTVYGLINGGNETSEKLRSFLKNLFSR